MDQLAVLEFRALSPPSPSCCSSVSRQHSSAGARAQCTPVADPKYPKYNDQSTVCTEFKCNIQAAGAEFGSAQLVAATKTNARLGTDRRRSLRVGWTGPVLPAPLFDHYYITLFDHLLYNIATAGSSCPPRTRRQSRPWIPGLHTSESHPSHIRVTSESHPSQRANPSDSDRPPRQPRRATRPGASSPHASPQARTQSIGAEAGAQERPSRTADSVIDQLE
jgi:hypothetical protein